MIQPSKSYNKLGSKHRPKSATKVKEYEKSKKFEPKKYINVTKSRNSIKSLFTKCEGDQIYTFVTIGVNTELVRKKMYPSLWALYKHGHLPKNIHFFSFGLKSTAKNDIRDKFESEMNVTLNEAGKYKEFWEANHSYVGNYLTRIDYDGLNRALLNNENNNNVSIRIFYISIPNSQLDLVIQNIKTLCLSKYGCTKIIVEKPFGKDLTSSTKITQQLLSLCSEDELYRVDEYLGKEIVQNILIIRFCNLLFSSTWNRNIIEHIMVTMKESYEEPEKLRLNENCNVIFDKMQLHMLQLLALVAMEKPISMRPNDICDEKVKLLKSVKPISLDDVVLGQYVDSSHSFDTGKSSSFNDTTKGTNTPTFCTAVIKINNERWDGVPIILKCGKALNENVTEIRVRYQNAPADIFECKLNHNELIIQIEPQEELFIKTVTKVEAFPSSSKFTKETLIPISSHSSYKFSCPPEPYENIILNVFNGVQSNFIRTAELKQALRIFSPLIEKIEKVKIQPFKYVAGSSGPLESDRLIRKYIKCD